MSAPTAGTAQPILSEHGLVAFVRLYMEQVLNAFPIQGEFGTAVPTNYDQLVVEIEETIRSTGSFDSKPTKATEEALERFSKVIVKALFQHKRYEYPTHALTQMRDLRVLEEAGIGNSLMATDMRSYLEGLLQSGVAKRMVFMARTYEEACIKILTETNPTFSVDGHDQTLDDPFGLNKSTVNTSWKTPTTDIYADFETRLTAFEARAGGHPDVIYVPHLFWPEVIVGNNYAKEFLIRNKEFLTRTLADQLGITLASDAERRFSVVPYKTQKTDANGDNREYLWPDDTLLMLKRNSPLGGRTLRQNTVRTPDNSYNGGSWAYFVDKMDPMHRAAVCNHNGIPWVAIPDNVEVIDYTP